MRNQNQTERRFGARLPPMKAAIVDAIASAGAAGITCQELSQTSNASRNYRTIQTHISAINALFEECDVRIRCKGGRYRIVQERAV